MRILITGALGMLGADASWVFRDAGHDVVRTSRSGAGGTITLDCSDPDAARAVVGEYRPDAVLHCAAYANVDGCERDPEAAHAGNAVAARNIADAADAVDAAVAYISTDYVFDGTLGRPYVETDEPNPLNEYGKSKLAGERLVLETNRRPLIARTSWLYGIHGKNFVSTMLAGARKHGELFVVADQRGTPTYTVDLARALLPLLERRATGVHHVTNQGEATWHEFAREIVAQAGLDVHVHPLTSEETAARFNTPTVRPKDSVLRNAALEALGLPLARPWREALRAYLAAIADSPAPGAS